jgi:YebC/PmpR family DNA-binding regulatory protein
MSGHSKWANIKTRKGAQDKKRSESFTKIAKVILTAIRAGGNNANPESNFGLKVAIEKAREVNMPKENIERLLTRFEERKANLVDLILEGYGPYSVPFIIEIQTDNRNRILGEIKLIFKNHGGALGESNSVAFQFSKAGEAELENIPEDLELELIDAGAENFEDNVVITAPENLNNFVKKAEELGLKVIRSEIVMKAKLPVVLKSEDELNDILEMIDELEENDDVINVYSGFDYDVKKA